MAEVIKNRKIPKHPLLFCLFVSNPHKTVAIFSVCFVLLASVLSGIIPYFFKGIIDSVSQVSEQGFRLLWLWAIGYVVVGLIETLSWRASGFFLLRWATGIRATSRSVLSAYVTEHSHRYFSNRFAGAIGSKLSNASEGVKNMTESFLWGWIEFIVSLVIGFALAFYTSPIIGLIFLVWVCAIVPLNIFFARRKVPLSIAVQERETELRGQTTDILANIDAMRDYARRTFELRTLRKLIEKRRLAGVKNWAYSEKVLLLNNVLEFIFIGGMIFVTIHLFAVGVITPGDIVLILAIVVSLRSSLTFIGFRFNNLAEVWGEVKEGLQDILDPHEIRDVPVASTLIAPNGEVVFDDVSFTYDSQSVFSSFNLAISKGKRVGLIGRSGAGKSTLIRLLTRQHDVGGGKICIDGQNISLVKQESLRAAIAVVPQDPLLFHRSLKENIQYGNLSASKEDIVRVAKLAQAHDFISALPDQYETLVGERGVKLSGGERQRVAIARAFLKKDAKILILDEATSSLDSESEVAIQNALEELMEDKTVIAIAHRLSTLRAMDRLIVLDRGKIIEDGTHDELLKLGGTYAELWSHQAGGFLQDM